MTLIATHFPRLTLLSKFTNNKFKNFKVFVNFLADGSFIYPYEFISGVSDQHIAIDILESQNFDISLLQRARDIIKHPENYKVPVS